MCNFCNVFWLIKTMPILMKIFYLSSLAIASSVGAKTVKCPVGSSNRGSKPGNDYWISWYCWQPRASETKMEFVSQLSELPIYLRPWVPLRTWQIQSRCWESDQGCSLLAGSSGRGVENGEDKIMIIAMMTATQMTKKMMTNTDPVMFTLSTTWTIPLVARMSLAVILAQLAITTLALCRWGGGGCSGSRSSQINW